MNTNAIQIKKKKQNKNKREGWKNIKLLSSTIFLFFLFMKKKWQKKIVSAKIIRINVCLWGVQRLKEVSFEHNCHSYTYSKKKKSYHILEKRNIFFFFWVKGFKEKTFILFFENFLFSVAKTFPFLKTWFLEKKGDGSNVVEILFFLKKTIFLLAIFGFRRRKRKMRFLFLMSFLFLFFLDSFIFEILFLRERHFFKR